MLGELRVLEEEIREKETLEWIQRLVTTTGAQIAVGDSVIDVEKLGITLDNVQIKRDERGIWIKWGREALNPGIIPELEPSDSVLAIKPVSEPFVTVQFKGGCYKFLVDIVATVFIVKPGKWQVQKKNRVC